MTYITHSSTYVNTTSFLKNIANDTFDAAKSAAHSTSTYFESLPKRQFLVTSAAATTTAFAVAYFSAQSINISGSTSGLQPYTQYYTDSYENGMGYTQATEEAASKVSFHLFDSLMQVDPLSTLTSKFTKSDQKFCYANESNASTHSFSINLNQSLKETESAQEECVSCTDTNDTQKSGNTNSDQKAESAAPLTTDQEAPSLATDASKTPQAATPSSTANVKNAVLALPNTKGEPQITKDPKAVEEAPITHNALASTSPKMIQTTTPSSKTKAKTPSFDLQTSYKQLCEQSTMRRPLSPEHKDTVTRICMEILNNVEFEASQSNLKSFTNSKEGSIPFAAASSAFVLNDMLDEKNSLICGPSMDLLNKTTAKGTQVIQEIQKLENKPTYQYSEVPDRLKAFCK